MRNFCRLCATSEHLILNFGFHAVFHSATLGSDLGSAGVIFMSAESLCQADTCTQIRVTHSPQDGPHDNTLNPTRQQRCPEKFTVTKVTCQHEAAFPALLRPLQASHSSCRWGWGQQSQHEKHQKTKSCFLLLTDCSLSQKWSIRRLRIR